jgi:hypothetical protein
MPQTQDLFPEDKSSKKKPATDQRQNYFRSRYAPTSKDEETAPVIVISQTNSNAVRHFDLVAQTPFYKINNPKAAAAKKDPTGAQTNKNKSSFFKTAGDFSLNAKSFPIAPNNPEAALEALLFYFDQIVYLNEMTARIEELDVAVADENIAQVNSLARACADISLGCGMTEALEPLRSIAQLKTKLQMTDAVFLLSQVRKELRGFRLALKENLKQAARQVQPGNPAARQQEMNLFLND